MTTTNNKNIIISAISIIIIIVIIVIIVIVRKIFRDYLGSKLSVDITAFIYHQCHFAVSKNQAEAKRIKPPNALFPELATCV